MKSVYGKLVIACAIVAGAASPALATENVGAKILVHVGATTTKNQCTGQTPANCRDAVVSAPFNNFYNVYVCVGNHSDSIGVAGVQFGLDYNNIVGAGVDIFNWALCATLEFPMDGWPAAGTGTIITWDRINNCQYGPQTAVAGYFYLGVYSPDRFSLVPRQNDGAAKVAGCEPIAEEDLTNTAPSALGYADFGTGDGYNPCSTIVPVRPATWSGVKSLYR